VIDARLTLLTIPGQETHYNLACVENGERVAFALHGVSERLFIRQAIEIVGDHCQTVSYAYRYQSGEERKSWLLRWEYFRERPRPDYEYPLAHVHANAEFVDPDPAAAHLPKPPSHLHIPTARVPLELVLWHVIAEWGVTPKTDDCVSFSASRWRASSDAAGRLDRTARLPVGQLVATISRSRACFHAPAIVDLPATSPRYRQLILRGGPPL